MKEGVDTIWNHQWGYTLLRTGDLGHASPKSFTISVSIRNKFKGGILSYKCEQVCWNRALVNLAHAEHGP